MLIDWIQYFDKIKPIEHLLILARVRTITLSQINAFFQNKILRRSATRHWKYPWPRQILLQMQMLTLPVPVYYEVQFSALEVLHSSSVPGVFQQLLVRRVGSVANWTHSKGSLSVGSRGPKGHGPLNSWEIFPHNFIAWFVQVVIFVKLPMHGYWPRKS